MHDRFHWNVMSGRYSVMPEEKWTPKVAEIRGQGVGNKQVGSGELSQDTAYDASGRFQEAYDVSQREYERMIESGVCREQARCVLPMAQYTEAFVTATLGDWMLFLKQRLDSHAQEEIRVYAEAVASILSDLFPVAMKAFRDYQLYSVRFSQYEMSFLREYLFQFVDWSSLGEYMVTALPNKREREEFLAKVKVDG